MPVLDFREIPDAHIATGKQDTFELFARDFLKALGFKVLSDPDRGADGGVDLLVEETRAGVGGETKIKWLVSCKHKASSGRSVSAQDDSNIYDRVQSNGCQGFMGFYSTIASSGLSDMLAGLRPVLEVLLFDREKIEESLLNSEEGMSLAARYFPVSFEAWKRENPKPATLFAEEPSLKCCVCNAELLEKEDKGVITLWMDMVDFTVDRPKAYRHIRWCCRGACDTEVRASMSNQGLIDGWEDINDLVMPTKYIQWVMTLLNQFRSGVEYSDEAFEEIKDFMLQVFPHVSRHPTMKEIERVEQLSDIPSWIGGLGT
ncbi:restriction endonuclease [Ruegeria arenilitoris]|uniref:restriction endonuclease n=1 Tax=Ruegeria arenilitoris TaxID=1173585 RepID=UPI00147B1280|nr:restriction endonuclease [Ruegeria arenilitoris]